jgi:hypothetical protein
MSCWFSKNYVLVVSNVGQANEQRLKFLLEEVYKIQEKEYQRNEDKYESEKYLFKIYLNTDGENLEKTDLMKIKSKIKAIICLENLNPRSNSLKDNLEQLRQVFTADELCKKLYVFFSFGTSTTPSSLDKLREDVLDFNEMYKLICLFDRTSINKKGLRFFCCLFSSCVSCCARCRLTVKPRVEKVQPDDLSVEGDKILAKENRLKIKFNSKRVWILDDAHILRKIKF